VCECLCGSFFDGFGVWNVVVAVSNGADDAEGSEARASRRKAGE
jgi:hypothetical protein